MPNPVITFQTTRSWKCYSTSSIRSSYWRSHKVMRNWSTYPVIPTAEILSFSKIGWTWTPASNPNGKYYTLPCCLPARTTDRVALRRQSKSKWMTAADRIRKRESVSPREREGGNNAFSRRMTRSWNLGGRFGESEVVFLRQTFHNSFKLYEWRNGTARGVGN